MQFRVIGGVSIGFAKARTGTLAPPPALPRLATGGCEHVPDGPTLEGVIGTAMVAGAKPAPTLQSPAMTAAQAGAQLGPASAGAPRGVSWWAMVSSAAAPLLLVSGWTVAAVLQPVSFNPVAGTVSALAADGAADRWVMTLAFLIAGTCEIMTGLALKPAAAAGRLILIAGGAAGVLVAVSPEPAAGGGSVRHLLAAVVGLVALAVWPVAAWRRGGSVPWGLRPAVSAGVSVVLLGLLAWFGAELVTGGGQAGLAERVMGGIQALWPLLVVLSCRWRQSPDQTPVAGPRGGDIHHEAVRDGGRDRQLCGHRS